MFDYRRVEIFSQAAIDDAHDQVNQERLARIALAGQATLRQRCLAVVMKLGLRKEQRNGGLSIPDAQRDLQHTVRPMFSE